MIGWFGGSAVFISDHFGTRTKDFLVGGGPGQSQSTDTNKEIRPSHHKTLTDEFLGPRASGGRGLHPHISPPGPWARH